jgi:hypothetical protein
MSRGRMIYLIVFIGLLLLAAPFVLKYFNLINSLTGQK